MWMGHIQQPRGKRTGIYKTQYGTLRQQDLPAIDTYVFTFSSETILLQLAINEVLRSSWELCVRS
jgi:hypothetical protein